jgi:hypothetical protein
VTRSQKCHKCGRVTGPNSCRQVSKGYFCLMTGLVFDPEAIIYPTIEIGKHEQGVIDEFMPLVEEESKLTDAALEAFSSAQREHLKALTECALAGIQTSTVMVGVTTDYVRARRLTEKDRQKLTAAEEDARENLEASEQGLARHRQRLSKLEWRFDVKRRAARDRDR